MSESDRGTTIIRQAGRAIVWDEAGQCDACLRDADIAYRGNEVVFAGRHHEGATDQAIDDCARPVMPGFIDIRSHLSSEPLRKGITDGTRSPRLLAPMAVPRFEGR
ncbi:MAG: hypothetical protein RIM84_06670 [Alphaproteobacteria bacterium]